MGGGVGEGWEEEEAHCLRGDDWNSNRGWMMQSEKDLKRKWLNYEVRRVDQCHHNISTYELKRGGGGQITRCFSLFVKNGFLTMSHAGTLLKNCVLFIPKIDCKQSINIYLSFLIKILKTKKLFQIFCKKEKREKKRLLRYQNYSQLNIIAYMHNRLVKNNFFFNAHICKM